MESLLLTLSALCLQGRQRVYKWTGLWNSRPNVREANKRRDKTFLTGLSSMLQNMRGKKIIQREWMHRGI